MADHGLHALGDEQPLTQRFFWLWIALAVLVGLVPGVAGLVWYRQSTLSYNASLVQQRATLATQNDRLSAENKRLESEVASAQASSTSGSSGSTGSDSTSAAPVPTPKPGEIAFVSRTIQPSPAAPGATITLATTIAGKATDAYMEWKSADGSSSKIYKLIKGSTNGDAVTWARSDAVAPKKAGSYTVFSWAFVGSKKATMPGAGELTVK